MPGFPYPLAEMPKGERCVASWTKCPKEPYSTIYDGSKVERAAVDRILDAGPVASARPLLPVAFAKPTPCHP